MHPQPPYGIASGLLVSAGYGAMHFLISAVEPVVVINGQKMQVKWDATVPIALPPGQYQVEAHYPWTVGVGAKVHAVVDVQPGHMTALSYRVEGIFWASGKLTVLGYQPTGA